MRDGDFHGVHRLAQQVASWFRVDSRRPVGLAGFRPTRESPRVLPQAFFLLLIAHQVDMDAMKE